MEELRNLVCAENSDGRVSSFNRTNGIQGTCLDAISYSFSWLDTRPQQCAMRLVNHRFHAAMENASSPVITTLKLPSQAPSFGDIPSGVFSCVELFETICVSPQNLDVLEHVSSEFRRPVSLRMQASNRPADMELFTKVAQSSGLNHLAQFHLQVGYFNRSSFSIFSDFVQSPHFPNLTCLRVASELSMIEHGCQTLSSLAKSAQFPNLTTLCLSHNVINSDDLIVFAESSHYPKLTDLNLSDNAISPKGMEQTCRQCVRVQILGTHSHQISYEGVFLFSVSKLCFSRSHTDGTSVLEAFAQSPHFTNLVSLDISGNFLCDGSLIALAKSAQFPNLADLNVTFDRMKESFGGGGTNAITDVGLSTFAQSPHYKQLARLSLRQNRISGKGLVVFAQSPNFPLLRELDVGQNRLIGDQGFSEFAQLPNLSSLVRLNIDGTSITDRGIETFAQSPHFPNLKKLGVDEKLSQAWEAILHSSPYFANLCVRK